MIRDLVQSALDTALSPSVLVHWQRKSGPDVDEYVVYTLVEIVKKNLLMMLLLLRLGV